MAEGRLPGSRPAARNPVLLALVGLICIAGGIALVRWQSFLFGSPEPPVAVTAPMPVPSAASLPPTRPPLRATRGTAVAPPGENAPVAGAALRRPVGNPPAPATAPPPASGADSSTQNAPAAPAATGPASVPAAPFTRPVPSTHAGPSSAPALPGQAPAPSFDIVRVDPSGNAVIAGRAPAGSTVTVTSGGTVIGTGRSDPEGQWVITPDRPLSAGGRTLALSASLPNGRTIAGSEQVVVVVPHQNAAPAMAFLDHPGRPRLIEAPTPASGGTTSFGLDLIQYGIRDSVSLAGHAPPGSALRIYLDNRLLGDVRADASGHWSLVLDRAVAPGMHQVRLDRLSPAGKVTARLAVPFDRAALAIPPGASEVTVVQPGQCLWLIAQHVYGSGVRYTLIVQANRSQIRNPNLIYPGQVFTLPAPGSATGGHG